MKKLVSVLLLGVLAMVSGLLERPAFAVVSSSLTIASCQDLQNINNNLSANYQLINDVDCSGFTFVPIGSSTQPFQGTLDGQGHTISQLTINLPTQDNVGLFGFTGTSSSISNVNLTNINISGMDNVGGLVGDNNGQIINAHTTGSVSGTGGDLGGLIGINDGSITNSYNLAGISGLTIVGGLVGRNDSGSISNSHNAGSVSASSSSNTMVGGLVGWNLASITNSHNRGNVYGQGSSANIGGLVGYNYNSITNSYNSGNVMGSGDSYQIIGGLVGLNYENIYTSSTPIGGLIMQSYNTGSVSALLSNNFALKLGGLAGENEYGSISQSYNSGNVSGYFSDGGGLVGVNDGSISDSYNNGNISASVSSLPDGIGGLVGAGGGSITNTYNSGNVSGSGQIAGGLDGICQSACPIINSFNVGNVSGGGPYQGGFVGENVGTITNSGWWTGSSSEVIGNGGTLTYNSSDPTVYYNQQNGVYTMGSTAWNFTSIWITDGKHYPILRWQEQYLIDLWNTFSAASQESTFTLASPPDTINWGSIDTANTAGVNWADLLVLSRPPVWSYQTAVTTAGYDNSVNWTNLSELTSTPINWTDVSALGQSHNLWASVNPLARSGVNWTQWDVASESGINWNNVSSISNQGINWNSIGTINENINWTSVTVLSHQSINWAEVSALSNQNANWSDPGVLNQASLTPQSLYTLRTIGVSGSTATPPPPPTSQILLNLNGTGSGTITSSPAGLNCSMISSSSTVGNCSGIFTMNQPVTLNFSTTNNSSVTNWGGLSCTAGSTSCTFTPDTSSLVVNLMVSTPLPVIVTASAGANGTISPSGSVSVPYQASQTFTLTPNSGYVAGLTVDGSPVPLDNNTYTLFNVTAPHTVAASFTVTGPVPAAPFDNNAFPGNAQVYVQGSDFNNEGITSYNVKRSLVSGGPYTTIGTITNLSSGVYIDNAVVNGTTYYYVLSAVNAAGESPNSAQLSATPSLLPPSPQVIAAQVMQTQPNTIDVRWNYSYYYSPSVTFYIYRSTGSTYTRIGSVGPDPWNAWTASYYDSPIVPGTSYYYCVSAFTTVESQNCAATTQTETITATAGANGTISPSGSVSVAFGANQTFTLTPNTGYTASLTVDGSPVSLTNNTYTLVEVGAAHTLAASFSSQSETITASSGNGGSISPSGSVLVNYNSIQTFIVIPNSGYAVNQVLVDGSPVTLTNGAYTFSNVTATHTIAASFTMQTETITASAGSNGTITPSGTVSVPYGANQTFTLTPNTGYVASLTVDGTAVTLTNNTYTLNNVTVAHTVAASFTLPPPTGVSVQAGNCQVSVYWELLPAPGSGWDVKRSTTSGGPYTSILTGPMDPPAVDTNVNNATTYYYVVAGIYGNVESANSSQVSVTAACSPPPAPSGLNAVAGNGQVALTWNASTHAASYTVQRSTVSNGPYTTVASALTITSFTDTAVSNGTTYDYVVTAVNAAGQSPDSAQVSASPNYPVSSAPVGLNATAGPNQVTLQWTSILGTTSYNVKRSTVSGGPYTTIASPSISYYTDQPPTSGIPYYYVVSAVNSAGESPNSAQVSATPIRMVQMSATAGSGGQISPSGTSWSTNYGNNIEFVITPNAGYVASLTDNGLPVTLTNNTYNLINIIVPHTLVASFNLPTETITASAGNGGTINPSGSVIVSFGSSQIFTLTPNAGYEPTLLVDGTKVVLTNDAYTLTNITAAHTVGASFKLQVKAITASAGIGGAISPTGSTLVNYGSNQTFTVTSNSGYSINQVLVDGSPVTLTNGAYTFSDVTTTHTIAASFTLQTETITASAGSNGSISPSGSTSVNYNDSQVFTITPNSGYQIASVFVDGTALGSTPTSYTFSNVTSSHSISVTFSAVIANTHTITSSAGANGNISPSGNIVVNNHDSKTFSILPKAGFKIDKIYVNGNPLSTVSTTYTFSNVTSNQEITVTFTQTDCEVNSISDNHGSVLPNGKSSVSYGGNLTYTFTPKIGYKISAVLVDGIPVKLSSTNKYTLNNIKVSHTISVDFVSCNNKEQILTP